MVDVLTSIFGGGGEEGDDIVLDRDVILESEPPRLEFTFRRSGTGESVSVTDLREADVGRLDREARVQLPVLVGLYADEVLEEAGDGVHDLPLDRLDELDPVDRRALDLQYERDWELRVDVESIIGSGENPLRLHWHSPRGGVEPDADGVREVPCGFYDTENDRLSPLPPELVEIRRLATRTVDSEPDSRAAEFRLLGRLDRLLESAPAETRDMVELAGQLEDESFLAPEEVQVDFRVREDGGLELRPLVDGFDDFESAGELLDAGSDERLFKREPDDDQPVENVRVALDEPTRREVDRVRDKSEVPPDEAMDFVQQPREYLQPADELEGEIDRETERTGQSREQARQQRAERDVLNLEPVEDRIARLELDDYGDRVLGFRRSRRGNSQRDDERGVDLEGSWFESPDEPRATPPSSGNEAEESSPDVESTGGEGAPGDAADDERAGKSGEKPSTGGLRGSPEASESDPAAEIDDVELVTADNDAELAYRSLLDGFSGNESIDGRAPDAFEGELYEHQRDGFAWLSALSAVGDDSERDERGGLLADDTGLGKTIQVIALFARRLEQGELTPSLLVVPKTLMANWEQEIRQFCPEIGPIYRHHGSGRLEQPDRIAKQEVVITTYGTLRADQLLLGKVEFQVMACDEAQRIKNYSTKRAAACRAMDAELKLPLTATPVENELDDLWSILDFCQPGLLGTLPEFREEFADPVEAPDDASERERAARRLRDEVRPHFVRRRKSEVLDDKIPDKRRHRTEVPISERQARAYRRAREAFGGGRGEAFQVIDNLLRICSHPIVTEARDEGVAAAVQTRALDEVPGNEEEIVSESGKLQHVFDQLLPDIRDRGGKALLFTRFRREQLLAQMLVRRYFGFRPDAINGDAAGSQRQRIVDRFCAGEGFDALVLSPRAAGVGLNIQAANHVIHLSREWNPAQEKQAADRVHRIGQDSTVHVHAPVAVFDDGRTSADARLDRLLDEKREMAHAVMAPSGDATVSTSEFDDVY